MSPIDWRRWALYLLRGMEGTIIFFVFYLGNRIETGYNDRWEPVAVSGQDAVGAVSGNRKIMMGRLLHSPAGE